MGPSIEQEGKMVETSLATVQQTCPEDRDPCEEGNWGQSEFYRRAHHSAVLTLDDVTQGIRKEDANKGKSG